MEKIELDVEYSFVAMILALLRRFFSASSSCEHYFVITFISAIIYFSISVFF